MQDWVKVFSSPNVFKSEMAREVLEESGITSVIINKHDSSIPAFGEAEVYVSPEEAETAQQVIKAMQENNFSLPDETGE